MAKRVTRIQCRPRGLKPVYGDRQVAIYRADCRDVLRAIPDGSVDCVLTDPPYGINYHSKRRGAKPIANDDSLNVLLDAMPFIERVLKQDSHAFIFASPQMLGVATAVVEQFLKVKDVLVWFKGNQGGRGDLQAGFSRNWEAVIHAAKGRRPLNRPRPKTVIRYDWSSSKMRLHPTEKPVGLMTFLLSKCCLRGDAVVDPFMGSGPVIRAAKSLGLRAVGVELDEGYCRAAIARVES